MDVYGGSERWRRLRRLAVAAMCLGALGGCTGAPDDTEDTPDTDDTSDSDTGGACAERTGGALLEFQIVEETLTVWMTDGPFIDAAATHLANGTVQVPLFYEVVRGTDCDPQWGWHPAPTGAEFADFTIELCDGLPSYVDAHLDEWIDQVGSYCPWSAVVTAVDDRR